VRVYLLDTTMSPAKTDEPIEMLFGLWTRVGQRNHVLGQGSDARGKGQFWGDMSRPIVKYRERIRSVVEKRLKK